MVPHPLDRPTISVEEAGSLVGLGRTKAYEEARRFLRTDGREGLPCLRWGRALVCPTAALWRLLGLDPDAAISSPLGRAK